MVLMLSGASTRLIRDSVAAGETGSVGVASRLSFVGLAANTGFVVGATLLAVDEGGVSGGFGCSWVSN